MNNVFFKNIFLLLIMQGVNYIIPLVTLPYLTRVLGGYQYGVLSTALTLVQYAILLIDFGFNLSATKEIAKNNNIRRINVIFWRTIYSKVLLSFCCFIFAWIIYFTFPKYNIVMPLLIFMLPQVIGSVFFPLWLFQGVERLSVVSIITSISRISILPLLIFFVKDESDIVNAAFILSLPIFISIFGCIPEIKKIGILKPYRIKVKEIKRTIIKSSHYFFGSVAISVYTLSTPIILSMVSNFEQVAYYATADKLRNAVIGVFLILGQAIYPRANVLFSKDKIRYYFFIRNLLFSQLFFCAIAMCLFYFYAPVLSVLLLGDEFLASSDVIKVMSPMILLIPSAVIFANCIMLPHGEVKAYATIPFITAIIHTPFSIVFCSLYGAYGGGISIFLTEVISFLFLFVFCYYKGYLRRSKYEK
ncbi:oligosaccharide flippase family protein [Pectobacterium cacticida]|uniref:oligosaccharide flippase family protein n=1 Tax=Pectobacterium cacticida TaxID=69221 RepID=UPI0039858A5A